jgi:hypothetical protein
MNQGFSYYFCLVIKDPDPQHCYKLFTIAQTQINKVFVAVPRFESVLFVRLISVSTMRSTAHLAPAHTMSSQLVHTDLKHRKKKS